MNVKIFKRLLPYVLSTLILFSSIAIPDVYVYANSNDNIENVQSTEQNINQNIKNISQNIIYNTETFVDEVAEKEFLDGIKKRQNKIHISGINEENWENLLYCLFYKYFPDEYLHGWFREKNDECRVAYLSYVKYTNGNTKFYINFTNDAYSRLDNPNYSEEYDRHINQLIINAGIIESMTDKEKIDRMMIYLCNTYRYDYDEYYGYVKTLKEPYWKIVSDYGVTVCVSDSMLFKACLDRLGIGCRLIYSENHVWNQVKVNGEWKAIDITGYREHRRYFKYFDDSDRKIERILN